MKIETFNEKYAEEGGFDKLKRMMSILASLKSIGEHFGVSRECVRNWMKSMFTEGYDPREERRKVRETLNSINK